MSVCCGGFGQLVATTRAPVMHCNVVLSTVLKQLHSFTISTVYYVSAGMNAVHSYMNKI